MYVDIDSAIKALKNCTNETDRQIAKWLEELKAYKQKPEGWMWDEAERKGYNKAIDDFAEHIRIYYALKQEMGYVATTYEDLIKFIFEIAEQLKAGEENGTDNK